MTSLKKRFFIIVFCWISLSLFQSIQGFAETHPRITLWNFNLKRTNQKTSLESTAEIRPTQENLLLFSMPSKNLPLANSLAYPMCYFAVDLSSITHHFMIELSRFLELKEWIKIPYSHEEIQLHPEEESGFIYQLVLALQISGYDGIIIVDKNGTAQCVETDDHAVLALSETKIHPEEVFLTREGSSEKISLSNWIWQKTWETRTESSREEFKNFIKLLKEFTERPASQKNCS